MRRLVKVTCSSACSGFYFSLLVRFGSIFGYPSLSVPDITFSFILPRTFALRFARCGYPCDFSLKPNPFVFSVRPLLGFQCFRQLVDEKAAIRGMLHTDGKRRVMSPLFRSTLSLHCVAQSLASEQDDDPLINNHAFVFIILSLKYHSLPTILESSPPSRGFAVKGTKGFHS